MSRFAFFGICLQSVLCSMLIAGNGHAQKQSIEEVYLSINLQNSTIEETFSAIEGKTDFNFAYKRGLLDPQKRITTNLENESLGDLLRFLSKDAGLQFKRIDENIHVSKRKGAVEPVLEIIPTQNLQDVLVSGKVSSDDGEELPGVSILVKGTGSGTTTDLDGNYKISVAASAVLQFSYIGYVTKEVAVGNQTVLNVSLEADLEQLEEVVVIGYGTQEKKDVTGAVESVKADQITKMPVSGFTDAMQGQVAGVYITQPSGQPGGSTSVRIRGSGSINSGNSPLYVVDGMIIQDGAVSGNNGGGVDVLSTLNPNDIESIDILKDASAAAIYGARGANGVIIVTTKKGKEGPAKFAFDAYYGTQSAWKTLDILNTSQYQEMMNEARDNSGDGRIPALDGTTLTNNTDWQDEILRAAPIQSYNLSIQGGSKNTNYFVSGNYFDQDGIVMSTGMKRGTLRFNVDTKKGRFKIGNNLTVSRTVVDRESRTNPKTTLLWSVANSPHIPVYDDTRVGGFAGPTGDDGEPTLNPVAAQTLVTNDVFRNRIMGNMYGEVDLVDGLKYRLNFGYDLISSYNYFYAPYFEQGGIQIPGYEDGAEISELNSNQNSMIIENTLTYNKTFGKHNLSALVGYTAQDAKTTLNSVRGVGGNLNTVPTLSGAGDIRSATGNISEWSMTSLLGRLTYDYDGKYLLTANIRRDGSSRFGKKNRYGVFPSVSVGWRVSEEDFLRSSDFISNLKVRGSYGVLGNDRIPNYASQVDLNPNANYIFGNSIQSGVTLKSQMPNEDLKWEQTAQMDIGVDLGLFNNQILFNVDYYVKKTSDMLLNADVPRGTGFASLRLNAGEVENKGFEFTLTYRKNVGDFQFDVSGNLTTLTNTVLSLGDNDPIFSAGWGEQANQARKLTDVGHPIGAFYGYQVEGIFQTEDDITDHPDQGFTDVAPGDVKYADIDGFDENNDKTGVPDGKLDVADRTFIGNPLPSLMYGLNFNANYKGFDFSMLFQGISGNDIFSVTKFYLEAYHRTNNLSTATLNRWRPGQASNEYPRAYPGVSTDNNRVSSRWIEKGDYLRLKNLQIGYSLPQNALDKLKVNKARIYVGGQNLLTFTDYLGWDPEVGTDGIDELTYPLARTILVGVQLGF